MQMAMLLNDFRERGYDAPPELLWQVERTITRRVKRERLSAVVARKIGNAFMATGFTLVLPLALINVL